MSSSSFSSVVVGVDGSDSSRAATAWAAGDAVRRGVGLRLVNAYLPPTLMYPAPGLMSIAELTTSGRTCSQQILDDESGKLSQNFPDLPVQTALRDGHPVSVLERESQIAVLTVVGSHGTHQFSGALLGSVAARIAARAASPLVVVRASAAGPVAELTGPIVVGVDNSRHAQAALGFAFDEAALRSVSVIAVHTWDDQPLHRAMAGMPVEVHFDDITNEECRVLAGQLAGWTEKYPDVDVQQRVLTGTPAATLLDIASAPAVGEPAQLLVVGSRGRGGFTGLLLGSTSAALIAHASCPVAVVRGLSRRNRK